MTPEAAIQEFFEQFGIAVYAATATPSEAAFPYLTYELVEGEWLQPEVNMPVNLWFRTSKEKIPNEMVRKFSKAIGKGGCLVKCDGGTLWLKKGTPWAQAIRVEGDDEMIKRRYLNINVEYLVAS